MKNKKIIFAGMVVSMFMAVVFTASAATTTPTIKVISPNGGEVWKAGTKKNIVFEGNLIKEPVTIAIQKSNSGEEALLVIGESVTSGKGKTSTYSWTIPTTFEPRSDYKISVKYSNNSKTTYASDLSDKTFTIKNASSSSSKSSSSRSSRSSSSKSSSLKSSRSSATTTSTYTLKVNISGNGTVSDGGRINCASNQGKACQDRYWSGATVNLTATPNKGYVFEKFEPEKECTVVGGGGNAGTNPGSPTVIFVTCQTTMNKNKTITAVFKKIPGASSSSKSKSSSSRSSRSNSSASSVKATNTSY